MALAEFLRNINTAARLLSPQVATDSPSLDPSDVKDALDRAALWLTPGAVNGFDPDDFKSLPADDREALRTAVERFQALAGSVPADGPAPPEVVTETLPVFLDVVRQTAEFVGLRHDPEERRVADALERVRRKFPDLLRAFDFRVDTDWSGEPAVHVWMVIPDGTDVSAPTFRNRWNEVRRMVHDEFHASGINRWPYVRLKTPADVRDEYEPDEAAV